MVEQLRFEPVSAKTLSITTRKAVFKYSSVVLFRLDDFARQLDALKSLIKKGVDVYRP